MGGRDPVTGEEIFEWVWTLKDEVTKGLKRRAPASISLALLKTRYEFRGGPFGGGAGNTTAGLVDDVELADVLVIMALHSALPSRQREDVFLETCHAFVHLLPVAPDAEILRGLEGTDSSSKSRLISSAHAMAVRSRVERGLNELSLAHYKKNA